MNLSAIIEESKNVQSHSFIKAVDDVLSHLIQENGKTGKLVISEHLVTIEPRGEALVIGDLHGDLESLKFILKNSDFINKLVSSKEAILIFLGDYGDRGPNSTEIYYIIMKLKLAFPEQVVLLRGNHEGPTDMQASPHDLPYQFQERFKEKWEQAYSRVRELFASLYNAVIVKGNFLMVHGGLSPNIRSAQDLATAHTKTHQNEFLEDLLWGDPVETISESAYSPRGAGKIFGKNVTIRVLNKLGVNILVRGHEPCENGFKLNHDGRVLTLFSRKGSPYFNTYGAYLQLPLFKKYDNGNQLFPWINKF